ncbi:MAG: hemolysin III family protein, partial [Pseudomonadota bacterium]|nr:hemolysin III family protein [Pseudomonadota bacterium]
MSHTSQISSPKNSEEPSMQAKAYSVIEEWLNSISHGIGFVAAIVGLVFMLYRADNTLALTTAAIYGSTLI